VLVEIQAFNVVLLALVDVNRFRMDGGERGGEIYFADHLRLAILFAGRIDDDEIIRRNGSQANGVSGIRFVDPMPIPATLMQESRFAKLFAEFRKVDVSEPFIS